MKFFRVHRRDVSGERQWKTLRFIKALQKSFAGSLRLDCEKFD